MGRRLVIKVIIPKIYFNTSHQYMNRGEQVDNFYLKGDR
ncbi:hypothetical protein LCGC14_0706500 [marine sediment metagenome]|uniref:Uncharacterized protein n=1 Tax=marine sediment metagenome TaxID=412755 RepID=A0A0F9QGA3_9ZZZZ